MELGVRRGVRRHLSLLISGGLVLLIGGLGLVAGHAAGQQAREVHRDDRLALQYNLAGLVEQYALNTAAEVADALAVAGQWSTTPRDPATVVRLKDLVHGTRALDAGAVLLSPTGQPLAGWSPEGVLPAQDDPGWTPLREAVASGQGVLPLSGILRAADARLLAMGLPVTLTDGSRGLIIGLWNARAGGLQTYVSQLEYGQTGHGFVIDGAGQVIAGPTEELVGRALSLTGLRDAIAAGDAGIVETRDGGRRLLSSYAEAGRTGWTAATSQDWSEFEGPLVRSSRIVEAAVVALLLIAGAGLVVLHRKRESALETVALRDELTGLYNRRGWFVLAEHELERARRAHSARVLLFVDLDGLKQVNDALGHREGDRAIADAANVLRAASRASDLVGRLGGDEFVLLLDGDGQAEAPRRRLIDALQTHNAGSGAGFELRLSVGAEVWFPDDACTLDELLRRADEQMYADKSSRPNRSEGLLRLPPQREESDATVALGR
jgi:diguanylate cyclase (GGDEF)-like protein